MAATTTAAAQEARSDTRVAPREGATLGVLQVALGALWLTDAALQFQPYMFGRGFVTGVLEPAAGGTPWVVRWPAHLAANVMIGHVALFNACFASTQLLIAVAIFSKRLRRLGLAASIGWSLSVWWLGEGIGGLTTGATALTGAPGAALLYAFAAVLLWPRGGISEQALLARSTPSRALSAAPKAAWAALWLSFAYLELQPADRSPSALHRLVASMAAGEPGWIATIDRALAGPLAHRGTEWSFALGAVYLVIAVSVFSAMALEAGLLTSIVVASAIWLVEGFGGVFTGAATDVNTGPLLVLLALTVWTRSHVTARGDPARVRQSRDSRTHRLGFREFGPPAAPGEAASRTSPRAGRRPSQPHAVATS
ncbi:MAG: hypothetical protein ACRDWW_02825 [Acidimicrobiales bacterium]